MLPRKVATELLPLWCEFAPTLILNKYVVKHFPITNLKHFYLLVLLLFSWPMQSNITKLLKQSQFTPGIWGSEAAINLWKVNAYIVQA